MPKRLLLLALIVLLIPFWGCQPAAPVPAAAPAAPAPAAPAFTGKVWGQTGSGLPGVMRIFLADGTLVMDSCWETYRLAQWRQVSDRSLVIVEDRQEIPTEILDGPENELHLRLTLVGGETKDEVYRTAPVPYVCPDMPR